MVQKDFVERNTMKKVELPPATVLLQATVLQLLANDDRSKVPLQSIFTDEKR